MATIARPSTKRPADDRPAGIQRLRVTGCLALIAAPHVFHLPAWVAGLAGVILLWQALSAWRDVEPPSGILRFTLAVGVLAAVFASFGRVNGLEAGVALLLLMLALKLSEIKSHRDAMVLLSLTYFLLITQFLFSQTLGMALYLALGSWLITAAFFDINSRRGGQPLGALFSASGRFLLQAVPIAAVLFVLFPRIPGPLWGLPAGPAASATTGLSDTMAPGSISQLATSDAVALRAQSTDDEPPPRARYWRGPVLWEFNRGVWSIGEVAQHFPAPAIETPPGALRTVRITLEPTRRDWLIALDMPIAGSAPMQTTAGAMLIAAEGPVDERRRYTVRSATQYTLQPTLPDAMRRYTTRLPAEGNPRARALAARWHDAGMPPRVIVEQALAMFRNQPFFYTLAPTAAGRAGSIDAFLFETREGFCEHYAGAFTFLMRAAGLPARIVTGYLGGERSTVGDYWLVRDADAHAWTEVWIDGAGWIRVDPTAAVAPERVESGVAAALDDDSALPYMARSAGNGWYQIQMIWDGINAGWNRWFLAYGPGLQTRVLGAFGLSDWRNAIITLTVLVVGLLAVVSVWLAWQARPAASSDEVARAWQRVCRRLAKRGYARARQEGPQAYCERVARARPDWQVSLRRLTRLYIAVRYAGREDAIARRRFLAEAARFRPSG